MARRFIPTLTVLLLAGVAANAQMIPGIGYPGGGYPGRRRQQTGPPPTQQRNDSASAIVGMLRKIEDKSIVVESEADQEISTILISGSTKYLNDKAGSAKIGDFQPGDHVNVSVNQDSKKQYHATKMAMVREGTPDEHSTASLATGDTSHPITTSANGNSSGSADKPVLHRADDTPSSGDRPVLHRAASASDQPVYDAPPADNDHPKLRRLGTADADNAATASAAPVNPDPPSRPQLKRAADTTPPPDLNTDNANSVARVPRRMPSNQPAADDPFIDQTREAAMEFSETLPNYIVKQFTTRYATVARRGGGSTWQALDTVTADVIEEEGQEKYKNILVNGKPPLTDVEKSGSWSKGEFSTLLKDVLSPYTSADFHNKRVSTIVNRAAFRYDFSVEQPNSHWHIEADGQAYMPAYSGAIWIDKENHRVLRIEMQAEDMPRSYPLDQVEWSVDYDYVAIGDGKYLLPVHSETLSCAKAANQCTRNTIEFRNYRKFTADTNITFEP